MHLQRCIGQRFIYANCGREITFFSERFFVKELRHKYKIIKVMHRHQSPWRSSVIFDLFFFHSQQNFRHLGTFNKQISSLKFFCRKTQYNF